MPHRLEKADDLKSTGKQLAFYWINDNQLVTLSNAADPEFLSDDDKLIRIYSGMYIKNNRNQFDYANLKSQFCYGFQ